jgi:hypothetical protein
MTAVIGYLALFALLGGFIYVVTRLVRSWRAAGSRWGGGTLWVGTFRSPPADLDEDVRQADEIRRDREDR